MWCDNNNDDGDTNYKPLVIYHFDNCYILAVIGVLGNKTSELESEQSARRMHHSLSSNLQKSYLQCKVECSRIFLDQVSNWEIT